jgi:lysophospholipase L1-like esterase
VMYCGENDFAASDTVTVEMAMTRFKTLFAYIQSQFKEIPFAYVSMKPSPSRAKLLPKYKEANRLIQAYLKKFKHTVFVDVYYPMLLTDGNPRTDIFLDDNLHMNRAGYAIWQKLIAPHLKK